MPGYTPLRQRLVDQRQPMRRTLDRPVALLTANKFLSRDNRLRPPKLHAAGKNSARRSCVLFSVLRTSRWTNRCRSKSGRGSSNHGPADHGYQVQIRTVQAIDRKMDDKKMKGKENSHSLWLSAASRLCAIFLSNIFLSANGCYATRGLIQSGKNWAGHCY